MNKVKARVLGAAIPQKRYFSIGEVSRLCAVKPHVLRYWEQEFRQLKPVTRTGGRRYYQLKDVNLVYKIRSLLYDEGFTIAGAKQKIGKVVLDKMIYQPGDASSISSSSDEKKDPIDFFVHSLEEILSVLG